MPLVLPSPLRVFCEDIGSVHGPTPSECYVELQRMVEVVSINAYADLHKIQKITECENRKEKRLKRRSQEEQNSVREGDSSNRRTSKSTTLTSSASYKRNSDFESSTYPKYRSSRSEKSTKSSSSKTNATSPIMRQKKVELRSIGLSEKSSTSKSMVVASSTSHQSSDFGSTASPVPHKKVDIGSLEGDPRSKAMDNRERFLKLVNASPSNSYVLIGQETRSNVKQREELPRVHLSDSGLAWNTRRSSETMSSTAKSQAQDSRSSSFSKTSNSTTSNAPAKSGATFDNHSIMSKRVISDRYENIPVNNRRDEVKKANVKAYGKQAEFGIDLSFSASQDKETHKLELKAVVEGDKVMRICVNNQVFEL